MELAAAPIVIGIIQGAQFVYNKVHARRPEVRLLKWEKRVAEAMSMVEQHKDYVVQSAAENFTSQCHMWREHKTVLSFKIKTNTVKRKELLQLTQRLGKGCAELVDTALNMSTTAMERGFLCQSHHAAYRRGDKCTICMPEGGQAVVVPTTALVSQANGVAPSTAHSSSPAIHYHIHVYHDQHTMAPDERTLAVVLPPAPAISSVADHVNADGHTMVESEVSIVESAAPSAVDVGPELIDSGEATTTPV